MAAVGPVGASRGAAWRDARANRKESRVKESVAAQQLIPPLFGVEMLKFEKQTRKRR